MGMFGSRVRKCTRCGRALNSNGGCPVCSAINRTLTKGKNASHAPRKCGKCGSTIRGGVCPGRYC